MTNASRNIRKLRNAVIEDVLAHFSIPMATSRTALRMLAPRWLWPDYYLRWDPGFSMEYYSSEQRPCVQLPVGRRGISLPSAIELAPPAAGVPITIEPLPQPFIPDQQIIGLTDPIFRRYRRFLRVRRRRYRNEQLLRLSEIVRSEATGTIVLRVQPVQYEVVCRTNLCMDAEETPGAETLRQIVHREHRLSSLSESRLAEPLGVNFLLLTADARIVLPRRSYRVVVRPGELSPSFSGDFAYADVGTEARAFNAVQLLREGFEELNLQPDDILSEGVSFLGLTRELVRGGKPEAFFIGRTKLTAGEFRERHHGAPDNWEFRHARGWVFWKLDQEAIADSLDERGRHRFTSSIEALLREEGQEMSLPLLTNLALWMHVKLANDSVSSR